MNRSLGKFPASSSSFCAFFKIPLRDKITRPSLSYRSHWFPMIGRSIESNCHALSTYYYSCGKRRSLGYTLSELVELPIKRPPIQRFSFLDWISGADRVEYLHTARQFDTSICGKAIGIISLKCEKPNDNGKTNFNIFNTAVSNWNLIQIQISEKILKLLLLYIFISRTNNRKLYVYVETQISREVLLR